MQRRTTRYPIMISGSDYPDLGAAGFDLHEAASVSDAIRLLQTVPLEATLATLDRKNPQGTHALLDAIKAACPNHPVILTVNHAQLVPAALQRGADLVLHARLGA